VRAGDAAELHRPVLAERCLDLLAPALAEPGCVMVDATLGMGGHSELVLTACPHARVIGIDRDPQALDLASRRLAPFGPRFHAVHAVYDQIGAVVQDRLGPGGRVQAILFDLGVSSLQLDDAERGFAYAQDAPLDMRMDPTTGRTAAEILAEADEPALRRILREYGEERFAGRIAAAIVRRRRESPLRRSGELVELVRESIPAAARRTGGNPAKRTFQALRIAVNSEIDVLERALPRAVEALAVGGRIVVEAYHSLEDRAVKRVLTAGATASTPPGIPVVREEDEPYLRLLTRGAEEADDAERALNPRSASVRLRAAERIKETPASRRREAA
jgi:16S rRNA (cytosine1402-N4)-methyltransferase